jgi:hypothetical protein
MFMKLPRNPINGELTARDDAPYAIPFHHSLMLKLEEQKFVPSEPVAVQPVLRYVDQRESTYGRPDPLVVIAKYRIDTVKKPLLDTMKDKRSAMDNELVQMQRVIELKKAMIEQAKSEEPGGLGGRGLSIPGVGKQ